MNTSAQAFPGMKRLDMIARLMDSKFSIPGTNIRFGFDALIGLIPGVGDLVSLMISSYLISMAKKNGASDYVVARMMLNTGIDTIVGAVPVIGDLFDVGFKANQRNVRLLQQHYGEGKHRGSAMKVMIPVAIILAATCVAVIWGMVKLFQWLF